LCDFHVASEIGIASHPLSRFGLLYRNLGMRDTYDLDVTDFDEFRSLLLFNFFSLISESNREKPVRALFEKSGRRFIWDPVLRTSEGFLDQTSPTWISAYFRKHQGRLRLPAVPKALRSMVFQIDPIGPAELLASDEKVRELHRWFMRLAGLSASRRG
jgi:hypothetical protein